MAEGHKMQVCMTHKISMWFFIHVWQSLDKLFSEGSKPHTTKIGREHTGDE
jgi:hypothetical protein